MRSARSPHSIRVAWQPGRNLDALAGLLAAALFVYLFYALIKPGARRCGARTATPIAPAPHALQLAWQTVVADAFRKLTPREQWQNPVMFVVSIGSIVTTLWWLQAIFWKGDAPAGFIFIIALIPLALKGVRYRAEPAQRLLSRNLLIYGVGGVIAPFIGINLIDIAITLLL